MHVQTARDSIRLFLFLAASVVQCGDSPDQPALRLLPLLIVDVRLEDLSVIGILAPTALCNSRCILRKPYGLFFL